MHVRPKPKSLARDHNLETELTQATVSIRPVPSRHAPLALTSTLKDGHLHLGMLSLPTGLGAQALLPLTNRLGSLAFKQPTAQFHAFLLEGLCTVCPCGHEDEALRHASCPEWQATSTPSPSPPSHLPACKDSKFYQETLGRCS